MPDRRSFLDWVRRRPKIVRRSSIADIRSADTILNAFGHGQDWANESYGNYYVQNVPVYRAVKVRADAVASARLVIGQQAENEETGAKEFTPIEDGNEVQDLLDRVNPWMSRGDLWRTTESYMSLYGSAFWFLDDEPFEGGLRKTIWPLHPSNIRVMPATSGVTKYIDHFEFIGEAGRRVHLSVDEVIWFRTFNPLDQFAGLSAVAPSRLTLDMGQDALRYNRRFFENGVMIGNTAFVVPGLTALPTEELEAFYKRIEEKYQGANNAHKPLLVPGASGSGAGVDVKTLGLSQKDMEFIGSLNFTIQDAARAFGVPPPMLYSQDQSKYANVKEWNADFWRGTIMPEWELLASTVTERLLPLLGMEDMEARFDFASNLAIQESMTDLRSADREDVRAAIMTINEVREQRGLRPVDWGDEPVGFGIGGASVFTPFTADEPIDPNDMPNDSAAPKTPKGKSYPDAFVSRSFSRRLDMAADAFMSMQRKLFVLQRQETAKNLVDGIPVFNAKAWQETFKQHGGPLYARVALVSAQEAVQQARRSIPKIPTFDPLHPEIKTWLERRVDLWASLVNAETGTLIQGEINEANALGESIPQIQERLEKVFKFNDAVRTERIARTEMLSTANRARLASYEQSGEVEGLRWLAAHDDRTRDSHADADGQTVPIHTPFTVGGAKLDAPGVGANGTMGPASEVINCRCTVVPTLRPIKGVVIDRPTPAYHRALSNGVQH